MSKKSKKEGLSTFKRVRINKYTGGVIKDYVNKELCFEDKDVNDPSNYTLEDSFVSHNGKYLGDSDRGWWHFKNNLVVSEKHPHGAAILLKERADKIEGFDPKNILEENIEGYVGYSHRGGQTFRIGDKIFDAKYVPKEEDFTPEEWEKYSKKREKSVNKQVNDGYYDSKEEALKNNPISDYVEFVKRGSKTIENFDDCLKAAVNLSNYLS